MIPEGSDVMVYVYLFLLLCLILFLIPFRIKIYYEFTDQSKYKITIKYLFGLVKKEIDSTSERESINHKNTEMKRSNDNKVKVNPIEYIKYFIDKGDIRKLYFRINIGFRDVSLLGIAVGIIWAIINSGFAYFLNSYDIDKINDKEIQVVPIFNQDIFEIFFLCIIKVNLVYIITAYIRILKIRKGGDSIARTSNRRINENYNE